MLNTQVHEAKLEASSGRHINYAASPESGPPLLLIHGISGQWQDWHCIFDLLADSWHIFAVDLRGHGKSSWTPNGYHWRNYSLDQIDFIERVIKRPTFVIGHSLGGSTALGLAAERADLVRAAVYEDPPFFVHRRWEGNQFRDTFAAILELLETNPDAQNLASSLEEMNPGQDTEYYFARAEKLLAMDPDVFRSTLSGRSRVGWLTEDLLPKATPPGLLLQADPEHGSALWDDEAETAIAILPDAEHQKWEGCGHGMHASHPERFAQRVNRFLMKHR